MDGTEVRRNLSYALWTLDILSQDAVSFNANSSQKSKKSSRLAPCTNRLQLPDAA
jgi:hypothetical protein